MHEDAHCANEKMFALDEQRRRVLHVLFTIFPVWSRSFFFVSVCLRVNMLHSAVKGQPRVTFHF